MKNLILLTLLSFPFLLFGQNEVFTDKVKTKLEDYLSLNIGEKLYLHTDRNNYAVEDNIWFKLYAVNAVSHKLEGLSKLAYVELRSPDGSILETLNLKVENGTSNGSFKLPAESPTGIYVLRAYTKYMLNSDSDLIFQKKIRVTDEVVAKKKSEKSSKRIDLQFFPEGGDLVVGLNSRVGFKAIDENGKGISVSGKIVDETGKLVSFLKSQKFGIGFFSFTPQKGKKYFAEVEFKNKLKFDLPEILSQGYALRVDGIEDGPFKVKVSTTLSKGLKGATLIAHQRGFIFGTIELGTSEKEATINFEKEDLTSDGIVHFTLFQPNKTPVCERLTFYKNRENETQVSFSTDEKNYDIKQKVTLKIETQSAGNQPIAGNYSASIVDNYISPINASSEKISDFMLLTSDLKGHIESPAYYFEKDDKSRRQLLDMLLLTQGWRRFNWETILENQTVQPEYLPEQGFEISGYTSKYSRENNRSESNITLFSVLDPPLVLPNKTDDEGNFSFTDLAIENPMNLVLQARFPKKNKEEQNDKFSIFLNKKPSPKLNLLLGNEPEELTESRLTQMAAQASVNRDTDSLYGIWTVNLDEFVVKGKRKPKVDPFKRATRRYGTPNKRLVPDSLGYFPRDVTALIQARFPGVRITSSNFRKEIYIPNTGTGGKPAPATIIIDGIRAEDANELDMIPTNQIEYIDLLRGFKASMVGWGANANGAIAVYTKQGLNKNDIRPTPGILSIEHPGYHQAREFYAPKYESNSAPIDSDYRITLHWEPEIITDENGEATISFYTCERRSEYVVRLEGITEDGQPVTGTHRILVNK